MLGSITPCSNLTGGTVVGDCVVSAVGISVLGVSVLLLNITTFSVDGSFTQYVDSPRTNVVLK